MVWRDQHNNKEWKWKFGKKEKETQQYVYRKQKVNTTWKIIDELSTRIYITNFPSAWDVKKIRTKCKEFGIVEMFSSVGKKFTFVKFLNISNVNNLVNRMQSNWYGIYHVYANIAYDRNGHVNSEPTMQSVGKKQKKPATANHENQYDQLHSESFKQQDVNHHSTSYASILKKDNQHINYTKKQPINENQELQNVGRLPVIQMEKQDEIYVPDATTVILGKVKSLKFIESLHIFCQKEGFGNVEVTYMGGSWVWTEFDNKNACNRFKQRDDMKMYFLEIQNLSRQFVVDDKIVWTEISGMPLGLWSNNDFKKVAKQ